MKRTLLIVLTIVLLLLVALTFYLYLDKRATVWELGGMILIYLVSLCVTVYHSPVEEDEDIDNPKTD